MSNKEQGCITADLRETVNLDGVSYRVPPHIIQQGPYAIRQHVEFIEALKEYAHSCPAPQAEAPRESDACETKGDVKLFEMDGQSHEIPSGVIESTRNGTKCIGVSSIDKNFRDFLAEHARTYKQEEEQSYKVLVKGEWHEVPLSVIMHGNEAIARHLGL